MSSSGVVYTYVASLNSLATATAIASIADYVAATALPNATDLARKMF